MGLGLGKDGGGGRRWWATRSEICFRSSYIFVVAEVVTYGEVEAARYFAVFF